MLVNNLKNWILTEKELPPIGKWVLVTKDNDWQKPVEIMCYTGIRIGTRYIHSNNSSDWTEEKYEYPAWTSGHGDIQSSHPKYWIKLPIDNYY